MTRDIDIRGFIDLSLIDHEKAISSVVFLPGCNFNCEYCHSYDIAHNFSNLEKYSLDSICYTCNNPLLDIIVISGGEPTINKDIYYVCETLKSRCRLPIKINTNGSKPEIIYELIRAELIDAIAMDIKTSFDKYHMVTNNYKDVIGVKKSIEIIMESNIWHEFRTTLYPPLVNRDDIIKISQVIKGCNKYSLQQFVPETSQVKNVKPYLEKEFKEMLAIILLNTSRNFMEL